jgi:hypothetical protein
MDYLRCFGLVSEAIIVSGQPTQSVFTASIVTVSTGAAPGTGTISAACHKYDFMTSNYEDLFDL